MPAQLLDGVALSKKLRTEIAARGAIVTAKGIRPGLAVIVVGENPASQVYVRNKVKACEDVGFHSVLERYSAELGEEELLARIATLNADPAIHGILVQLPLPEHIAAERVLEAIAPEKDVDGFHVANAGALMVGQPEFDGPLRADSRAGQRVLLGQQQADVQRPGQRNLPHRDRCPRPRLRASLGAGIAYAHQCGSPFHA